MVRIGSPKRGDLVLATFENKGKRADTRRLPLLVAGLPGDTIESYAGAIYVNGKSWFPDSAQKRPSSLAYQAANPGHYRLVLRSNEFWLLTYSRHNNRDSRHYGPIARNRLFGIQAL